MTMSTTAAIVMMLVLVVVSAIAVIVFATASATVTVTTTATCEVFHHMIYLFLRGIAVLQNGSLEVKCLSSQRVVEVHLHLVLADFQHATVETLALFILQGNDSVLKDMLVVEMSVDTKHLTVEI